MKLLESNLVPLAAILAGGWLLSRRKKKGVGGVGSLSVLPDDIVRTWEEYTENNMHDEVRKAIAHTLAVWSGDQELEDKYLTYEKFFDIAQLENIRLHHTPYYLYQLRYVILKHMLGEVKKDFGEVVYKQIYNAL